MTARWFTDCAANGPAPIDPEFTDTERASFETILDFARVPENRAQEMELMHCLDSAGTRLIITSTGVREFVVTPEVSAAAQAATDGVRFWHNHPSRDSLSHSDWQAASSKEQPEVLALNEHESFFVGRIVDWDDRFKDLFKWLPRLARDLHDHLEELAAVHGLSEDATSDLCKFTGHVLNLALADHTTVRYAYRLVPVDQATIDRCSSLGIIQDGRAFAANSITWKLGKLAVPSPKPNGT